VSARALQVYDQAEFEREAERLASLVWDAMGISVGDRVLFCGYGPDVAIIKRAAAEGAVITVIESRDELMKRHEDLGVAVLRGSTSAIPAKTSSFDLAVANSYLHEIDPLFHANVIQELGRVAARVVIVEPMPPSDPLGKRIATLYSRAKRELGQFEYYQAPSYWRRLLSLSKPQIAEAIFAFSKLPPREYLIDTLNLLLDTMRVEEAPEYYIDQLREIANQPGALLLPQGRLVLVGMPEKGAALPPKSMAALLAGQAGTPSADVAVASVVPPITPSAAEMQPPDAPMPEMGTPFAPPGFGPAGEPDRDGPAPQPDLAPSEAGFETFGIEESEQAFGLPGIDEPPSGWHWEPPEETPS